MIWAMEPVSTAFFNSSRVAVGKEFKDWTVTGKQGLNVKVGIVSDRTSEAEQCGKTGSKATKLK